jgi:DNA-directed RNA polymerase subunit RPC12/RpoP
VDNIIVICISCKTRLTLLPHASGTTIQCPRCNDKIVVPVVAQRASKENNQSIPRNPVASTSAAVGNTSSRLVTKYATCFITDGNCVGFEQIAEQYISGSGSLTGSHSSRGEMRTPNYGLGGFVQTIGTFSGYGSISGSSRIDTDYRYNTRFFLRSGNRDIPISITGNSIQLLDGHAIGLLHLQNSEGKVANCAVLNRNTKQVYYIMSEADILWHLRIPKELEVVEEVLSDDLRQSKLLSCKRKRIEYGKYAIAVIVATVVSAIMAIAFLVFSITSNSRTQFLFSVLFVLFGAAVPMLYYIYYSTLVEDERRIKFLPSHKTSYIRNTEIDEELDAIHRFAVRNV